MKTEDKKSNMPPSLPELSEEDLRLQAQRDEEMINAAFKKLIDTCAPGGGYMFETSCGLDYAKRENVEVMFDTVRSYGKA